MAISTYSDLVTAVAEWADRDDLAARIPDFIRLSEIRCQQELELVVNGFATVSGTVLANGIVGMPTNFLEARSLRIGSTSGDILLRNVALSEFNAYRESTSSPAVFIVSGGYFEVLPTPASGSTYTLDYLLGIPALGDNNQTNWLMQNAPNLLLYGALLELALYMRDDQDAMKWSQAFDRTKREIRRRIFRLRTTGPMAVRGDVVR